MSINTRVLKGVHFRTPNKFDKYKDPWDNLLYAMVYGAMQECKHDDNSPDLEWLDTVGRDILDYLKDRPLNRISNKADKMRKRYTRKRIGDIWLNCYVDETGATV